MARKAVLRDCKKEKRSKYALEFVAAVVAIPRSKARRDSISMHSVKKLPCGQCGHFVLVVIIHYIYLIHGRHNHEYDSLCAQ